MRSVTIATRDGGHRASGQGRPLRRRNADIKYCGGHREFAAICDQAARGGVSISPHNPSGRIAHAHTVHACTAIGLTAAVEQQFDESPLFDGCMVSPAPTLSGGRFECSEAPGLGAAVDLSVAAQHPLRPVPFNAAHQASEKGIEMNSNSGEPLWPTGYVTNPRHGLDNDIIKAFRSIPVPVLGDCLGRHVGAIGLKPYHGDLRLALCGPALTVRVRPGDNLMLHKAMLMAEPGDIVVADGASDGSALAPITPFKADSSRTP